MARTTVCDVVVCSNQSLPVADVAGILHQSQMSSSDPLSALQHSVRYMTSVSSLLKAMRNSFLDSSHQDRETLFDGRGQQLSSLSRVQNSQTLSAQSRQSEIDSSHLGECVRERVLIQVGSINAGWHAMHNSEFHSVFTALLFVRVHIM